MVTRWGTVVDREGGNVLKLSIEEFDQAVKTVAGALERAENGVIRTSTGKAAYVLGFLSDEFDIAPMERNDIAEGNVWPESDHDLAVRAFGVEN
jgi:hypothetical protein